MNLLSNKFLKYSTIIYFNSLHNYTFSTPTNAQINSIPYIKIDTTYVQVDTIVSSDERSDSLYVEILGPEHMQTLSTGITMLWGFVYGPRVSLLEKPDFRWYSNIDGFLEEGKIVRISGLTPGFHKIMLTVENGNGLSASDTVVAIVQDQYLEKEPKEVDVFGPP